MRARLGTIVAMWAGVVGIGLLIATSGFAGVDGHQPAGVWLFEDGSGTEAADSSGNGLDGVFTGEPSWVDGKFGGGISLPGAGDTVAIEGYAGAISTDEITITLWANMTEDKNQDIFSLEPLEPGRITSHMPWDNAVHWQFGNPFTGIAPAPLTDAVGVWKHWAYVHSVSENRMTLYENGAEVSGGDVSSAYEHRDGGFHIGGRPGSSFAGVVDDFAIFPAVLSVAEINAIMTDGLAGALGLSTTDVEANAKLASVWGSLKASE
jgi:hypothetical protein